MSDTPEREWNLPEQTAVCLRSTFHLIPREQQPLIEDAIHHLERMQGSAPSKPPPLDLNSIHGEFEKMEAYRERKEQMLANAIPSPVTHTSHVHRCMSCGARWYCPHPPSECKADENVFPSLVLSGPDGPTVFHHGCQTKRPCVICDRT